MASNPELVAVDGAAAAAAAAAARVSKSTIASATNALFKHKAALSANEKPQLLPQDDYIYLNLTLKKIPSTPRSNPFKIPLSHPVLDPTSQLCLIIDDRPKTTTPPSDQIKKLIKSLDIPISKVIKTSKLKTNYKPFEAKRKLCGSFDLFLVDKRVVHLLPRLLGKEFFKKKKVPLGVDLSKKNLKSQVEKALGSALLYLRTGTCCVMKVGKVAMEKDEVVENVFDAIKGAVERLPKKWDGVRSLHLKFSDSVALPIYQAMPDLNLKIEGLKEKEQREAELAKVSDSEGEKKEASGRKDGKSGKKKRKGRIHEVHYMDVGEDIESDDNADVEESEQVNNEVMEGNFMEENDVDEGDTDEIKKIEHDNVCGGKNVGKKRNKGKAMKEGVLGVSHEEKPIKKKSKQEKSESEKPKKGGMKGKKKSELEKSPSERIAKVKDAKQHKKRVSGK